MCARRNRCSTEWGSGTSCVRSSIPHCTWRIWYLDIHFNLPCNRMISYYCCEFFSYPNLRSFLPWLRSFLPWLRSLLPWFEVFLTLTWCLSYPDWGLSYPDLRSFLPDWGLFYPDLRCLLPWLRFCYPDWGVCYPDWGLFYPDWGFLCFFLSCKANARVKFAKTGHGPHSPKLVVICAVLCIVYV